MKYIGSTKQPLNNRLSEHKYNKKHLRDGCSSVKLDLEHSVIYEIERCHQNKRMEQERYWINKIDCVNERKLTYNQKDYDREYYLLNKERKKEKRNDYRQRCKISEFLKMLEEY